LYEATMRT